MVSRAAELQEKIRIAEERREDMSLSKRKMNIIWIHKWALIKEKKDEMERICSNIRNIKNRKKTHIRAVRAYAVIKKIYEVFNEQRQAYIRQQRIEFLAS